MSAEYFYDGLRLLLDVSFKAILLCGLAGIGLWVLRVRNDNVQHRLWAVVLMGMLLLPLLVSVMPSVPLPSWLYIELPTLAAISEVPYSQGPESQESAQSQVWHEDPIAIEKSGDMTAVSQTEDAIGSQTGTLTARDLVSSPPAGSWPLAVLAIYAIGFFVFLLRLLVGVDKARRLVSRGHRLSLDREQLPQRTTVLETAEVRVPMVAGWFRPCVLLPADWSVWSEPMLVAALAHEQAHIARRDHWVALLAEVNRCVYWFHPVAWYVRRKLIILAEHEKMFWSSGLL